VFDSISYGGNMQALIDKFKLIPHPEGGYYTVVYESKQSVKSPVVNKVRKALTHIYFLLLLNPPESIVWLAAALHRVLNSKIFRSFAMNLK
jgi:predicted cupin superfamily sugar epimerase